MDLRAVEKRNYPISKYYFTSTSSSFGPFGRVAPNNDLIPCILNLFDITFARSSLENPGISRDHILECHFPWMNGGHLVPITKGIEWSSHPLLVGNDDPLPAFGSPGLVWHLLKRRVLWTCSGYFGHVVVSDEEAKVLRIILKIFVFYLFSLFFLFKNSK